MIKDGWRKLNYLVPEPQCKTRDGEIIEWTDARRQPTTAEIKAVRIADVEQRERDGRVEKFEFPGSNAAIIAALYEHESKLRVINNEPPITLEDYRASLVPP